MESKEISDETSLKRGDCTIFIVRRYKIDAIYRCRGCGQIMIKGLLEQGTAEDPEEGRGMIPTPDLNKVIPARSPGEAIVRHLSKTLGEAGIPIGMTEVHKFPGGEMIIGGSNVRKRGPHDRGELELCLNEEEFKHMGSLKLGDIIVQRIEVEQNNR